jgi:glyoxylase-like metal-dependent hydrolase (beta-lactamase superfamily II)
MTTTATTVTVAAFRVPEGCVAYLIWDPESKDGLIVDPRLDQVEELAAAAREKGVRVRGVIDTHTHADHLSGARRLAVKTGAEFLAAKSGIFKAGTLEIQGLAAPGHTPDSVALLVGGHVFTGDALFLEGVGRTDFPGGSPDDLLGTLERLEALPGDTVVHPGHDYPSKGEATLEVLRREHPVLSEKDRAARRERVAGKGAAIPDIRDYLAWNLAKEEPADLPARASQALARGRSAVLVDVRTPAEIGQMKIAGSIEAPYAELGSKAEDLPKDAELILVCRTGLRSRGAQDFLRERGIASRVMAGGLDAWRAAGLPVSGVGGGVLPIDRQLQLTVGFMVFTGVLLGVFVTPWALIVPGFFGAGLMFAGATGLCGLTHVLAKLPWNRPKGGPPPSACSAGGPPVSACSAGTRPPR